MSRADLIAIAPLIVVSASTVVLMLAVALRRSHALAAGLSWLGLTAALLSLGTAWSAAPHQVGALLVIDQ
jgi:NADH-quinone oxidoreductase subunit N